MDLKRHSRIVSKWIAVGIVCMLVLLGLLFGVAQTEWGKRQMSARLSAVLSDKPDTHVMFGRIDGLVPFDVRLSALSVGDRSGEWLAVDKVVLRWSPGQLLQGRVRISELRAASVRLERLPTSRQQIRDKKRELPRWPPALPSGVVEQLKIEKLAVGSSVVGEEAAFSVDGRLNTSTPDARVATSLQIQRIDGPEAQARISTSLKGEKPVLTVDVRVQEETGGFFSKALGFKETGALSVRLFGEGPLAQWEGKLIVHAEKVGQAEATISWSGERELRLTGEGMLNPFALQLPPSVIPLLNQQANFALDMTYRDGREVIVHKAGIAMNRADLTSTGQLDLKKQTMAAKFNLTVDDLSALESLIGTKMSGNLSMSGEISGTFQRPQARASMTFRGVKLATFEASGIECDLLLKPIHPLVSSFPGLAVEAKGHARDPKHHDWKQVPEAMLQWSLVARMPEKQRIVVEDLHLRGEKLSIKFAGEFNPWTQFLKGDAEIDISDLRPLSGFWGSQLRGAASVRTHLHAQGGFGPVVADFDGYLKGLAPLPPAVAALAESQMRYNGRIELVQGRLTVTGLQLRSDATEVAGEGVIDLLKRELEARMYVSIPRLTVLSEVWGKHLSGSLDTELKIHGPLASQKLLARGIGTNILLAGIQLPRVEATLDAQGIPTKPQGHVELHLQLRDHLVQTSSAFALDKERLTLSGLAFTGAGATLAGNLSVNFQNRRAEGTVQGKADDLSLFSSLLGEEIGGSARVRTVLTAGNNGQEIRLDLSCENLDTRSVQVKTLGLSAHITNAFKAPSGSANVTIEGIEDKHKNLMVDAISLAATGGRDKLRFSGKASGQRGKSFELEGEGIFQATRKERLSLEIERFQGRYDDCQVVLAEPMVLMRSSHGYELKKLKLTLGPGVLRASGTVGRDEIALTATFDMLPLDALSSVGVPGLTGSAGGEVRVVGRPERPTGRVRLHVKNLELKDTRFEPLGAASVTSEADFQDGLLRATLSLEGMEGKPIQARLQLPMSVSFSPVRFAVAPAGKIEGDLTGEVNLAYIPSVFYSEDHMLKGRAIIELTVAGETHAPELRGNASVVKASYHHARMGTMLKDIKARIAMKEQKIVLEELGAVDGNGGVVSAKGWFELNRVKNFPLKFDLHLEKTKLIRDDNITATSTGDVSVSGALSGVMIAGALDVGSADIRIPEKLPPEIVELDVVEINRPGKEAPPPQARGVSESNNHQLNLQVSVPGRVFLRGRGLESEWKGKLRVTGTVKQPIITGNLAVVRGHFDLFGKRFGLSEGSVTFAGNSPPSPQIDVTAELTKRDITARLRLSGPFSQIGVKLESDPPLPEDEILAHILFGRSVAKLTPMQALKLGQGLNRLGGAGGGALDFMDRARRLLGVERLDVQQEEGSTTQATVTVGKYLTEDIYVEVDEPVGTEVGVEGTRFSVEVEITPNISVESEGGLDAQGGVGFNWKWDY